MPVGVQHARTPAAAACRERGIRVVDLTAAMREELRWDDWLGRFTSPRGALHRVTRILTGQRTPTLGEACAIAEVLGVPSQDLFPEVESGPHPLAHVNGQRWSWSSRAPQGGRRR